MTTEGGGLTREGETLFAGKVLTLVKMEVNVMGKNMDTKKDSKKKPAKSMKEKRAEKKAKKDLKSK